MLDVRHTLPNLKYLLYVLTARMKEVPGRKAGGVRGLLRGGDDGETSLPLSRSESLDGLGVVEVPRIRTAVEDGEKGKGKDSSLPIESLKTGVSRGTGMGVSS